MEIKGKVHCFFEQSATFRDEFRKLGYESFDYDIQNSFGKTDFQIDLFKEIDPALYEEVRDMNQDHIGFASMTNVGRKAILQTLTPNVGTFTDIHGGIWVWDGEYLHSNNTHASFTLIETREIQECRLKPNGNVAVKVSDDAQVNDNTEFID